VRIRKVRTTIGFMRIFYINLQALGLYSLAKPLIKFSIRAALMPSRNPLEMTINRLARKVLTKFVGKYEVVRIAP